MPVAIGYFSSGTLMLTNDKVENFISLLTAHEVRIRAFAMTLMVNRTDLDDVLQQAHLSLWENFHRFEPGTNFMAWAARVVHFAVLAHRKRRLRDKLEFGDAYLDAMVKAMARPNVIDELGDRELALASCIAKLQPDHRDMLRARYDEGADMDDIVARFRRSRQAIYNTLCRVRRALYDCVTEKLGARSAMNRFRDDDEPCEPDGAYAVPDDCWELVDGDLEGRLTGEQRRWLEELVVGRPDVADLYLRAAHLWAGLVLDARGDGRPVATPRRGPAGTGTLHEAMILPALRESELPAEPDDPPLTARPVAPLAPAHPRRPGKLGPGSVGGIAAAAALVVGGAALWLLRPGRPAVVVTATAGAVVDGLPVDPRSPLAQGRALSLTAGALELTFDSGAVAVVAAPARVTVLDRNTMALDAGSMTAHVPPPAVGFRVNAPGLSVVDRGTNFGVRTAPDRSLTVVDVFDGSVDAVPVNGRGDADAAAAVRVTAGHAVRHDAAAPDAAPAEVAFEPAAFARTIADVREPLPLHGTGADVPMGAADPYWQVVATPGHADAQPRPAYAATRLPRGYAPNEPGAKWISTAASMPSVPPGAYVYRTTIDLTGFDPATVAIFARVNADDDVEAFRVNGRETRIAAGSNGYDLAATQTVAVPGSFRPGLNDVEVVVVNRVSPRLTQSESGLKLSWNGSACRPVHR